MKSFHKFLAELGVTNITGWRWRKRRYIEVVNIAGRLYVTDAAVADFERRATSGEFRGGSLVRKRESAQ